MRSSSSATRRAARAVTLWARLRLTGLRWLFVLAIGFSSIAGTALAEPPAPGSPGYAQDVQPKPEETPVVNMESLLGKLDQSAPPPDATPVVDQLSLGPKVDPAAKSDETSTRPPGTPVVDVQSLGPKLTASAAGPQPAVIEPSLTCPQLSAPNAASHGELHPISVQGFHLFSPNEGWLLAGQRLYLTSTGGQTWEDITPPNIDSASISAVSLLSSQQGWLILTSPTASGFIPLSVASTLNGGKQWQINPVSLFQSEDVYPLAAAVYLQFIDSQTGWIVVKHASGSNFSVGSLFGTTDAGNTWKQLSIPIGEPVNFITHEIGWTAGGAAGDELYRTQDGGQTWQRQAVHSAYARDDQAQQYRLPTFENAVDGTLPVHILGAGKTQVELYATSDAGRSFELLSSITVNQEMAPKTQFPLAVLGRNYWTMIVPRRSELLKTADGTAVVETTSTDQWLPGMVDINMATPEVGWAKHISTSCTNLELATAKSETSPRVPDCSSETRLLRTEDGGQTWRALELPGSESSLDRDAAQGCPDSTIGVSSSSDLAGGTQVLSVPGFDTCQIPSLNQMQVWWNSSPYRAVNLYYGGNNRGCANSALTSSYVSQLYQQGWRFIPTWVGPQSQCWQGATTSRISNDTTQAYNQGVNEASSAADTAANLGLGNSIIYYDLEGHTGSQACREAAKSFISGWTGQLQSRGQKSGVYGSSGAAYISDFAGISNVPYAIWPAGGGFWASSYSANATVWGNRYIADGLWSSNQRIYQYTSGHQETWGGVTYNIDSDVVNGVVATPGGTPLTVPAPPTSLRATALSSSSIQLTWQDNSNNETGFRVQRWNGSSFVEIARTVANATNYTDNNLQCGTNYYYTVGSYNNAGTGWSSNWVYTTTSSCARPNAPTNLSAAAQSSSSIRLTWQDNSSNETGFLVDRWNGSSFVEIARTLANATNYTDNNLQCGTNYYYTVGSYSSAGTGWSSYWVQATTPSCPRPNAPTGLRATAQSSSSIQLTWQDNSSNETGFLVDRWNGSTGFTEIARTVANATSYTDNNRQCNTTYYYTVGSYNNAGVSWSSNWVYASTGQCGGRSEVIVDDLDGGFQRFGPVGFWHQLNIGYRGHTFWTYNEVSSNMNWARWTPTLANGNYEVFAYIPADGATTTRAWYVIHHAGGTGYASINQSPYSNQWVSLGTYNFSAGTQGNVDLGDATGEPYGSKWIGFDAMRFVPKN